MRPTTQKQASKRAEVTVRRHKALELKIAGHSDRAIARILDVDVSTAHRDVKNVLETLAREHAEEAANLRSLLTLRYEILFRTYYDQAGLRRLRASAQNAARPRTRVHATIHHRRPVDEDVRDPHRVLVRVLERGPVDDRVRVEQDQVSHQTLRD